MGAQKYENELPDVPTVLDNEPVIESTPEPEPESPSAEDDGA